MQTVEVFSVESVYNGVARFLRVHSGEADAAARTLRVAQYPRGNDLSVRREHRLQVDLADVRRHVGDVQIRRVLLLLLRRIHRSAPVRRLFLNRATLCVCAINRVVRPWP